MVGGNWLDALGCGCCCSGKKMSFGERVGEGLNIRKKWVVDSWLILTDCAGRQGQAGGRVGSSCKESERSGVVACFGFRVADFVM